MPAHGRSRRYSRSGSRSPRRSRRYTRSRSRSGGSRRYSRSGSRSPRRSRRYTRSRSRSGRSRRYSRSGSRSTRRSRRYSRSDSGGNRRYARSWSQSLRRHYTRTRSRSGETSRYSRSQSRSSRHSRSRSRSGGRSRSRGRRRGSTASKSPNMRRSLSQNDQSQSLPGWLSEWKDLLECPVCLKTILDPPLYLCEKGHVMCQVCRDSIKGRGMSCPICRGALTKARNITVEKMLERLPKNKCKYEDCQFKRAGLDIVKEHEVECDYRLVGCGECDKGIALVELTDHLRFFHGNPSMVLRNFGEEKCCTSAYPPTEIQQHLVCNDINFYINRKFYNENWVMFWISICGNSNEADKYEYTFKIESSAKNATQARRNKFLFTGSGQCVSCEISHEDIKQEMTALLIDRELLERAAVKSNGKKKLWYRLAVAVK